MLKPEDQYIDIVLERDGPNTFFVEIEDPDGVSISIGKHTEGAGFHRIRISAADIMKMKREQ